MTGESTGIKRGPRPLSNVQIAAVENALAHLIEIKRLGRDVESELEHGNQARAMRLALKVVIAAGDAIDELKEIRR